jgi:hypothetical protein
MGLDKDKLDEFYREYYDIVQDINSLIIKYGLTDDCFSLSAVGWFKDVDTEEASLDMAYHINVDSEDDLDEILAFLTEGYRQQDKNDPSKIDYWLNRMGGGDIN